MYFFMVILGLIIGALLIFMGIRGKNSDIISIGWVLSIFFLLICINIYIPNLISNLKTSPMYILR
ncbi:hypothetical protein [Clostridium luticellarii]|jgi:hypothetical protein|uniref:Uncharacterized protein n=1 Tax=Clostridium luticellarii TaxID=1691940 RepID=A0A2T0BRA4_9CLOT|nr:hypothetical protein [Clostridium luticellarii]MCI1943896.1 hypothetical protein [Clostridium luticellarii]MCI1967157.1 hypothetical protein [Clostridium luticellarii]MCI1994524.1 hypothetical protein [Clostridium luticellarii]MCI2038523.1 hypothetical protein [Clostridium luticellarii]PRR86398.1 hypothetical protein CLLU_04960 [Clostridium luticellarii]